MKNTRSKEDLVYSTNAVLRITIIYLVLGSLWILFSDKLLSQYISDPAMLTGLQTVKGWFFILITAGLLFILIRRNMLALQKARSETETLSKHIQFFSRYANDIILLIDSEGRILEANERASQLYGYDASELLNFRIQNLHPPDVFQLLQENMQLAKKQEGAIFETISIRKDGSRFPVEVSSRLIEVDGKNFFQNIIRDITERKEAESKLKESERKLFTLMSNLPGMAYRCSNDPKWTMEFASEGCFNLTGYSASELINNNRISYAEIIIEEDREEVWQSVQIALVNKKPFTLEYRIRTKNGKMKWVWEQGAGVFSEEGELEALEGFIIDITERKEAEEKIKIAKEKAEESDRMKSEFLGQVSHEIRTPLNIMLSYNSILKEELQGKIQEGLNSSFASIDSAGKRLMRTIDLILNMAAFQTGHLAPNLKSVDFGVLLSNLIKEFTDSVKKPDLKLLFTIETDNPSVVADDYIAAEIFQNLIDNAFKYTPSGEIEVRIYRNKHNDLCVSVRDTGIGISQEYLPYLFKPFSQEETGYTRRFEGNGLGLALVKNYTDMLGAKVLVESEKGKGSMFTVMFGN